MLHLYNPADTKAARTKLLADQDGLDLVTGLPIPSGQAVLDHSHTTQFVRGVLHRQVNVFLGKIENSYVRYIGWWYEGDLPTLLRQCADYLERGDNRDYVHPGWLKASQVQFNKLPEGSKKAVLEHLESDIGANATERKKLFQKALMTRKWTYEGVLQIINKVKE